MDIRERRLTTSEVQDLTRPLQNDLIAFYGVLADAADSLLDKAVREGWTPERYIDEVAILISGDNRPPETVAVGPLQELKVLKARRLDGRTDFQGLPVSIENATGSTRSGVDPDGHPWSITMMTPYGYIRGTEGVDGDAVDVFVGGNAESQLVFIVHIKNPDGSYDEDKAMIGFNSEAEARQALSAHYDRDIILNIDTLNLREFRERLENKPGEKIKAPRTRAAVLDEVQKAIDALLVMKGAKPVGTISDRKDGKYQKYGPGDWRPVSEETTQEREEPADQSPIVKLTGKEDYEAYMKKAYASDIFGGKVSAKMQLSVKKYVNLGYQDYNSILRGTEMAKLRGLDNPQNRADIKNIATYINKNRMKDTMPLYRGVGIDFVKDLKPGAEFIDKAFGSFSAYEDFPVQSWGSKAILRTVAKKGAAFAPTLATSEKSFNSKEGEFLAQAGTRYKVGNVVKVKGITYIDLEVIE